MGDAQDGSSSAAQRALVTDTDPTDGSSDPSLTHRPGFLGRFFGAFKPLEDTPPDVNGAKGPAEVPMSSGVGLGNLRLKRVEDVMLPKVEIVSVPSDIKKDDLVEIFRETKLTRLPVFKGTLDTPQGMVHLKDFALQHGFNGTGERFTLSKMLRPLLFAPPSMPIGVLLQKMQSDRMHMALVIDEYGGVDGLVTIEDLIEQVIGEIEDEHDIAEGQFWTLEKPGCYLVQAKTLLEDFEAETGASLRAETNDEEIDTLGGLVVSLAGRVPARGEVIKHPNGPDFEVVDADPRRIKRLRVRLSSAG